jgi:hypothetical protein
MNWLYFNVLPVFLLLICNVFTEVIELDTGDVFKIEGRVEVVSTTEKDWMANTQVVVDGGEFIAHLK